MLHEGLSARASQVCTPAQGDRILQPFPADQRSQALSLMSPADTARRGLLEASGYRPMPRDARASDSDSARTCGLAARASGCAF